MKLYELTEMYSDLFNQFDAINEWEPDTNADGMPIDDDGNIIASSDFTVTVEKKDGFFKILFRIITAPFRAIINLFKKLFGK